MNASQQGVDGRQKALQDELRELVDVVGPGPLVDLLLERAFQLSATDIHLDPNENGLRIRLRVDGILHDVMQLPSEMTSHVISRIKLMANMDITERRMAQDGHISNAVLTHQRDVRVGSGPTILGERLVLRLMPDQKSFSKLEELGLSDDQIILVKKFLNVPYGVILGSGPVGSGKTTTIYTCLEMLNDSSRSLVTIEDPVERRTEHINQMQIDPKVGFTFVQALRGVLRQDPDVMMIGEIRDPESAKIGIRAGLTGVTVLSTIHASDTATTIDVFREFEIAPMFIADSVRGIISQRLIRKICNECKTTYQPSSADCEMLGIPVENSSEVELARGTGCGACFNSGYTGRTGIFEVMEVTPTIRDGILKQLAHSEIRELATSNGMQTLEDRVRHSVISGVTSVEEMHRVLTVE